MWKRTGLLSLPLLTAIVAGLCLFSLQDVSAQDTNATPAKGKQETPANQAKGEKKEAAPDKPTTVEALESVIESIQTATGDIDRLNKSLKTIPEVEKESVQAQIKSFSEKKTELEEDFESIATGIKPEDFEQAKDDTFVLTDELDVILRPIIQELKDLTEKPREIEDLRRELAVWTRRRETTDAALLNLNTLPADLEAPLKAKVAEIRLDWSERRKQAENRIQALSYQLKQAEANQPSIIDAVGNSFRAFFRSRGRNFLLCIFVFFAVYFGLRFLHKRLYNLTAWKKRGERPFYIRLIDVGLNLFSFIGAALAGLIVLYATGDWVLMGVAIILLVGVAVGAKNALPRFYDTARVLLNLGEVREGERVVYDGVPWKIERLSFYTILINEHLRGGHLRLPVRQMVGLISRPISKEGEPWFPCEEGDWLLLPDAGHCRVVTQTPEVVQVVKLGGAKITIPTGDFLSMAPTNLSHNFRISSTFGIDYSHQEDCTEKIPQIMWQHLTKEICQLIGDKDLLLSLKVEFASAGASSLDYEILADFDGELAARYRVITRAIQRLAVDCCNENGWIIPFTQITLHNAFPAEPEVVEKPKPKEKKLP